MKLSLPTTEMATLKKEIANAACVVVIASLLKEKEVIARQRAYAAAERRVEMLPAKISKELFEEAFATAWGEMRHYSITPGQSYVLIESQEGDLVNQKLFYNYIIAILKHLVKNKREITRREIREITHFNRSNKKKDLFNDAFDYLVSLEWK